MESKCKICVQRTTILLRVLQGDISLQAEIRQHRLYTMCIINRSIGSWITNQCDVKYHNAIMYIFYM